MATTNSQEERIQQLEHEIERLQWGVMELEDERDFLEEELLNLRREIDDAERQNEMSNFARMTFPIVQILEQGGRNGPLPGGTVTFQSPRDWEELYCYIEQKAGEPR